jgi:hypothetical protein
MTRSKTFSIDIGWRALLKDSGLPPERILRRAGLPEDLLARVRQGPLSRIERKWVRLNGRADKDW